MEKIIHSSRDLKSIKEQNFASDLAEGLPKLNNTDDLQNLYEKHIKSITSTLDQHAPETNNKSTKRLTKSWYDKDTQN